MAAELGRSPSTVADEVSRNRSVSRGPGKGSRAGRRPATPAQAAVVAALLQRLQAAPLPLLEALAGRVLRRQGPGDGRRGAVGGARGVDRDEREFESMMAAIRSDVARGLSPAQIAAARGKVRGLRLHHIPLDRARVRGNVEPRAAQEVRVQRGARAPPAEGHGPRRGALVRPAFMGLPDEERGSACEMDTVIGLKSDGRCLLTLYQRPCKFQLALLMPGKDAASTERARSTRWRRRWERPPSRACSA